jgi:hypothetical protein
MQQFRCHKLFHPTYYLCKPLLVGKVFNYFKSDYFKLISTIICAHHCQNVCKQHIRNFYRSIFVLCISSAWWKKTLHLDLIQRYWNYIQCNVLILFAWPSRRINFWLPPRTGVEQDRVTVNARPPYGWHEENMISIKGQYCRDLQCHYIRIALSREIQNLAKSGRKGRLFFGPIPGTSPSL